MEYFLLVTVLLLFLALIWGALGFGRDNFRLIKNDKIAASGLIIFLGPCTICWAIWITHTIGFLFIKISSFFSYML